MAAPKPAIYGAKYVPQFNGDEGLVMMFPEAAGQSFVAGDLLQIVGSGAGSGNVSIVSQGAAAGNVIVVGHAESNATGVTGHQVRVRVYRPGDVFIMPFVASTTFTVGTTVTVAGYDIGSPSAGLVQCYASGSYNKVMVIGSAEFTPSDAAITPFVGSGGDMNILPTPAGPVYVKIKPNTSNIWYAN